ncbi:MAG: phosphatase PAP2 family protein [Phycisphaerae bacterium]
MSDRRTGHNDGRDSEAASRASTSPKRRRIAVALLWSIAAALMAAGFLGLDRWFYEQVALRFSTPNPVDRDPYAATALLWDSARYVGSMTGALIAYFVVLAIHPKGWRAANTVMVAILVADALGLLVKDSVCRVRPNQAPSHLTFMKPFEALRLDTRHVAARLRALLAGGTPPKDLSPAAVCFPSGEATAAFALATVLSLLYPRAAPFAYAAAVLAALARILAGAHYISDVTAGAVIGTFTAAGVFRFLQKRRWRLFL